MSPSSSDQQSNFLLIGPNDKPSDFNYYGIVYRATNKVNGKVYVGITTTALSKRIKGHISSGNNPKKVYKFQRAIRKYGIDSFAFDIIVECLSKEDLCASEVFYINLYQASSQDNGYNLTSGGEGGTHFSEESKQKLRISHLGRKHAEETKLAISAALIGRKVSEETRQKQSLAKKGKHGGENAPMYGKHHSEETKQRMSKSHTGLKRSPENTTRKAVQQLDKEGNILESFSSLKEASLKCSVSISGISSACSGRIKTCGGFIWRFKNEEDQPK